MNKQLLDFPRPKKDNRKKTCRTCIHNSRSWFFGPDYDTCTRSSKFTETTKQFNLGCDYNLRGWE